MTVISFFVATLMICRNDILHKFSIPVCRRAGTFVLQKYKADYYINTVTSSISTKKKCIEKFLHNTLLICHSDDCKEEESNYDRFLPTQEWQIIVSSSLLRSSVGMTRVIKSVLDTSLPTGSHFCFTKVQGGLLYIYTVTSSISTKEKCIEKYIEI